MTTPEIIFCNDWADVPAEERRTRAYRPTVFDESEEVVIEYFGFTHKAEVLIYALANGVQEGRITADEARDMFVPYKEHMPYLYEKAEWDEDENGFPTIDYFMDWGAGPGTSGFWEEAGALGIEGIYFNEGEHPGGGPVFYLYRREALKELQEALTPCYKIVVRKVQDYDTSDTSDPEDATKIIRQARGEKPAL